MKETDPCDTLPRASVSEGPAAPAVGCGWQAIFNCQTPWGLSQLQSGLTLKSGLPQGTPAIADPQRCGYLGPTGIICRVLLTPELPMVLWPNSAPFLFIC